VITRSVHPNKPSYATAHAAILLPDKARPSVARTVHDTLLSLPCKVLHESTHTLAVSAMCSTALGRV
jgi:hypothetical protein